MTTALDRRSFLTRVATMATALSLPLAFLVPPVIYMPTEGEWIAVQEFCSHGCVPGRSMTKYLEGCLSLADSDSGFKAEASRHLAIIGPCVRAAKEKYGWN